MLRHPVLAIQTLHSAPPERFHQSPLRLVTDALRLLTRNPGVPYRDYVDALLANPIAHTVKRADLEHNLDETRSSGCRQPDEAALSQRRERYRAALAVLNES